MSTQNARFKSTSPVSLASGWSSCNGFPNPAACSAPMACAPALTGVSTWRRSGSQISAIDVETGAIEAISPMGGDIVAPDDLVFDPQGNLYATEITEGRVSVGAPNGETRVLYDDMPCANPITFRQGRLIAGECRPGAYHET